jgi:hypothetical protein
LYAKNSPSPMPMEPQEKLKASVVLQQIFITAIKYPLIVLSSMLFPMSHESFRYYKNNVNDVDYDARQDILISYVYLSYGLFDTTRLSSRISDHHLSCIKFTDDDNYLQESNARMTTSALKWPHDDLPLIGANRSQDNSRLQNAKTPFDSVQTGPFFPAWWKCSKVVSVLLLPLLHLLVLF